MGKASYTTAWAHAAPVLAELESEVDMVPALAQELAQAEGAATLDSQAR